MDRMLPASVGMVCPSAAGAEAMVTPLVGVVKKCGNFTVTLRFNDVILLYKEGRYLSRYFLLKNVVYPLDIRTYMCYNTPIVPRDAIGIPVRPLAEELWRIP
jgi:hypothetical protein